MHFRLATITPQVPVASEMQVCEFGKRANRLSRTQQYSYMVILTAMTIHGDIEGPMPRRYAV
jgi:hypothetical protein